MSEWMVTLDTPPGVSGDEGGLLAFSDALDDVRGEAGASASVNRKTGTLSASFAIVADGVQEAVDSAVGIFNEALKRAGFPGGNIAHVDADPLDDRAAIYA